MQNLVWPEGWPLPNYENPPTRGSPYLFIVVLLVTTIVVALRFYSRYFLTRSLGIDDAFLLAGFIISLGQTFAEYKALTTWGWNMHLWDIPPARLEYIRLAAWLTEMFFLLGTGCTKVSILLVHRRISTGSNTVWFIRLTWVAIAFTVTYVSALLLELMLVCRPLEAYWKSFSITYHEHFTCANERAPVLLSAVASMVSDIYASVLPMLLVRKLQLSRRQRISIFVLFSAGLLTAGTGIARIYYLDQVTTNYQAGPHTHDVTWLGWPIYAWTDIEAHLAIICASAPALKVFFTKQFRAPQAKVYTAPYSTLPQSQPLPHSHTSSSNDVVQPQEPSSRSNAASTSLPSSEHIDQTFEMRPTPTDQGLDPEKAPLEKIVDVEKALPDWPAPVWGGPATHDTNSNSLGDGSSSSDGDSSRNILPIFIPRSRYNKRL